MASELIVIPESNVPAVFATGGLDPILEGIRKEVSGLVPDLTTAKGRAEIASVAAKVARSKTYLDGLGKALVETEKRKLALVDSERKRMRDYLDALKEEVRRPLTEWEQAEEQRVAARRARLLWLHELPIRAVNLQEITEALAAAESTPIDESWAEFAAEAAKVRDATVIILREKLEAEKRLLADREELARLRREAEENIRLRREEEIARQAAEAERTRVEQARRQADAKAAEGLLAIERAAALELETARRQQAEAERKLAEERLAAERARAAEEAARVKAEQERQAREADQMHRATINRAAAGSMVRESGITEEQAKSIVTNIARGLTPHITITY